MTVGWVMQDPVTLQKVNGHLRRLHQEGVKPAQRVRRHLGLVADTLRIIKPHAPVELTADEAWRQKIGDCSEGQKLLYEISRRDRLDPILVEFTLDKSGGPFPEPHLGVGFRFDPKDDQKVTLVDATLGEAGFDVPYLGWYEIPKRVAVAYDALWSAVLTPAGLTPGAKERFRRDRLRRALWLAPDNPHVRFNLGVYYREHRSWTEAEREFTETLRISPHYPDAAEELEAVLEMKGSR